MKHARDKRQRSLFFDQPTTDADVLSAFQNSDEWLSRRGIADRVNRVKSPALVARMESLVDRACLERATWTLPNGVEMVIYRKRPECDGGLG